MDEFARSFNQADQVYLLDIYAASEKPIEGVTSTELASKMRAYGHRGVHYAGTIDHAVDGATKDAQSGDLIMTLGAGNVWQAGDRILERLRGAA